MRHIAREVAMKIAFARLLGGEATYDETIEISYSGTESFENISAHKTRSDEAFAHELVEGVNEHRAEIDDELNNYLNNWSVDTISKIELTILRIAMYELMFSKQVPQGAIINEAVELAKEYCDDNKHMYINGVLGSYVRDMENQ